MQEFIKSQIASSRDTIEKMLKDENLLSSVEIVAKIFIDALQNGKKIIFAGNGGSAADSQHLAAELVSRLCYDRPGLNAIALTTDTSALTAIGNDYGYERVFARQIEAIGQEGDIFVGISTSGNSANIVEALKSAKEKNITTIGFVGRDARKMAPFCQYTINAPSDLTPKIQECHITLGHIICALAEEEIFGAEYNPKRQAG
ncbi:D-sedoheptulose 7-phosphate isomerase [Rickettsiales bacterium]|nr:D-sedoheptulose 7-phosphate isomerase [Rickettsiales bacterium]